MASANANVETSVAQDFSNQLDQIFGLENAPSAGKAKKSSSALLDQGRNELDELELKIRATEERLRKHREEYAKSQQKAQIPIKPKENATNGAENQKPGRSSSRASGATQNVAGSTRSSVVSGISDTLSLPKSRPASNAHTISSIETTATHSSGTEQSRKPSLGSMLHGLKRPNKNDKSTSDTTRDSPPAATDSDIPLAASATAASRDGVRKTSGALKVFQRNKSSALESDNKESIVESELSVETSKEIKETTHKKFSWKKRSDEEKGTVRTDTATDEAASAKESASSSVQSDGSEANLKESTPHKKFSWKKRTDEEKISTSTSDGTEVEEVKAGSRKVSGSKNLPSWMKRRDVSGTSEASEK